jgi:DNA-binding SARP family transcriptional activator
VTEPSARPDGTAAEIDAALSSGEFDRACRLIAGAAADFVAGRTLRNLSITRLRSWLRRATVSGSDSPWLLYYQAWVAAALREQVLARHTLERAEHAFAAQPPSDDRDAALRLVALGRATVAQRDGDEAGARAAFASAAGLMVSEADLPGVIDASDAARWTASDPSGAVGFWLTTARSSSDPLQLARALHNLAYHALDTGEPVSARRLAAHALRLKRDLAPASSVAITLNTLGMAQRMLGAHSAARDDLEEARALGQQVDNAMIAAYALCNLGELHTDTGRTKDAEQSLAMQSVEKESLADDFGLAYGWRAWARARRLAGDADGALALARRACALRAACPDRRELAALRTELGACMVATGELDAGATVIDSAVELARDSGARATLAAALVVRATTRADRGAYDEAQALVSAGPYAHLSIDLDWARVRMRPERGDVVAATAVVATPTAQARLIGGFELRGPLGSLTTDGWHNRRAAALLRALALHHDHPLHVEQVYEWFWPAAVHTARASLNTAVSMIRSRIEEIGMARDVLRRLDDQLTLTGLTDVDLDVFRTALSDATRARHAGRTELAIARLGAAIEPWRGQWLLPADRYADWSTPARHECGDLLTRARTHLVTLLLQAGRPDQALGPARDALATDPLSEQAYRQLIAVHLARSDAAAASTCLAELRAMLRTEFGQEPSAATLAIFGPSASGATG